MWRRIQLNVAGSSVSAIWHNESWLAVTNGAGVQLMAQWLMAVWLMASLTLRRNVVLAVRNVKLYSSPKYIWHLCNIHHVVAGLLFRIFIS